MLDLLRLSSRLRRDEDRPLEGSVSVSLLVVLEFTSVGAEASEQSSEGTVSERSSKVFVVIVECLGDRTILGSVGATSFVFTIDFVGIEESTESSDGLVMSDRMGRRGREIAVSESSDGDVATYRICRLGNRPPPLSE